MKKNLFLVLIIIISGCSGVETSEWKSNPQHRAYISTRLADAIVEYNILTDDTVIEEELCDGSGWITQGDGHRTECPGCSKCEKSSNQDECLDGQCPTPKSTPVTQSEPAIQCEPARRVGPLRRLFGGSRR